MRPQPLHLTAQIFDLATQLRELEVNIRNQGRTTAERTGPKHGQTAEIHSLDDHTRQGIQRYLRATEGTASEVPFGPPKTRYRSSLRPPPDGGPRRATRPAERDNYQPIPPPSDPPLAAPVFSPVRASVEGDISQAKIGPATKARYATKPKKKGAKGIKERLRRGPKSSPADGPRPDASRATAPHRPWQDAVRTPPFDPSPTRRAGLHGTYLSIPRQPLREPLVINE